MRHFLPHYTPLSPSHSIVASPQQGTVHMDGGRRILQPQFPPNTPMGRFLLCGCTPLCFSLSPTHFPSLPSFFSSLPHISPLSPFFPSPLLSHTHTQRQGRMIGFWTTTHMLYLSTHIDFAALCFLTPRAVHLLLFTRCAIYMYTCIYLTTTMIPHTLAHVYSQPL